MTTVLLFRASISIHAPREGGDDKVSTSGGLGGLFQSTPPARGATVLYRPAVALWNISIHAPREGGDLSWQASWTEN